MTEELAFFSWIHAQDGGAPVAMARSIRRHYPDEPILLCADGPIDQGVLFELQAIEGCVIEQQPPLKQTDMNRFLRQGYSFAVSGAAGAIIQLDPGSRINRPAFLPASPHWHGQLFFDATTGILSTIGAGALFSRAVLQRLVAYLADAPAVNFRYRKGASADLSVGRHLSALGIKPVPWVNPEGFLEVDLSRIGEPGEESISHWRN